MVRALEELPGVKKAFASFPEKKAIVWYYRFLTTTEQMGQALLKAGYVARPKAVNKTNSAVRYAESPPREFPQKEKDPLICYCFEYTRDDIEQDFIKTGRSLIMEKIAAEKKAGRCDCATQDPKGR